MSLINFLNPKLKPSVECEAVSEDGYSASNLIENDTELHSRGFMGYAVSKPPVEIVFLFPKAADLRVLKVFNRSGAFLSTAFDISTQYEGIWEKVSSVRDLESSVDSVTFCYQSEYSRSSQLQNSSGGRKGEDGKSKTCNNSVFAFFYKSAHKILANANTLKITIRATHKCPPVLRKVEVWGLPSRSLDKADRELVKTIWSEIVNPYNLKKDADDDGQRSPSRCLPELNEDSTLQIPEDFLDQITWDMMIFPTVLPSGKIVDQSTIDKHSEVEAKWGRMPSDPFTGLEFTSQRKAILDLALKARIEKFLMENADHFKSVPRSLGSRVRRSRNRHASQFASLCQSYTGSSSYGAYSSLTSHGSHKSLKRSLTATTTTTLSEPMLPPKQMRLSDLSVYRSDLPNVTSTATQTTASSSIPQLPSSHLTLSSSISCTASTATGSTIDLVLQRALETMTHRYTQPPIPADTKTTGCIECGSEEFAYEIQTCKHLVCRGCLVILTSKRMCSCNTSFKSSDIERYHKL